MKRSLPSSRRRSLRRSGLALFDLILLIGVCALLLSFVLPEWQRRGLLRKAIRLRAELSEIQKAASRAATALELPVGAGISFEQCVLYLDGDLRPEPDGLDPFGHPYGDQPADTPALIPAESYRLLNAHVEDSFWAPFVIPVPLGAHGEES